MSDWLKIGIMCILFVASMYAAHILVNLIAPVLVIATAVLVTVMILRLIILSKYAVVIRHPYFIAGVIALFIGSLLLSYMATDFIKLVAWFLIGWYLFRVLLYLIAEDIYHDINEFITG